MRAGIVRWLVQTTLWAATLISLVANDGLNVPLPVHSAPDRPTPAQQFQIADPGGIGGVGG